MNTLSTELRGKLEKTCIAARNLAEKAARAALEAVAVQHHDAYGHMSKEQKDLRNKLRARGRQLGDVQDAKGQLSIEHLAQECGYEHWHRMLFARCLAENNLLIEPEMGVAISLDECKELAKDATTNLWALAGRYAQMMLPEVFRADDPVLQVPLAREDQLKLEHLLDALPAEVFTASDSLGWCYQFWQAERKDQVNAAGNKIGADELPSVTQLFTEDYMVNFLLDNTLGAWWAGKVLADNPNLATSAKSEEELRKAVALPGAPWKYLRFIEGRDSKWTPAAGTFEGWPKTAKDLKCLDPCCGSGHFIVAMFERLLAMRMAEEKMDEQAAVTASIRDNLFGLEIDPRCTQIGAFSLAMAAWRRVGHCALPPMHIACSGLAPNTREADWLKLAGDSDKLQRGMARLYRLFQNAPVLGSLISPRAAGGDLVEAGFQELRPLLEKALVQEAKDDTAHEMAVTAQGITKAAEILAGQFTLAATNVPYLGRKKQVEMLMDYCERVHPEAKADLATCFVERCLEFCTRNGTTALVTPQNWLFLGGYQALRERLLKEAQWDSVVRLGARAFDTISGEIVNVSLVTLTRQEPSAAKCFVSLDASAEQNASQKDARLLVQPPLSLGQSDQLRNPDARISAKEHDSEMSPLGDHAECYQGAVTGDLERFRVQFWEVVDTEKTWQPFRTTIDAPNGFDGLNAAIKWQGGQGELHDYAALTRDQLHDMHESGNRAWNRLGVAINRMGDLLSSAYLGEIFDNNVAVAVPKKRQDLAALLAFCSSPGFAQLVRSLDQTLKVTNRTLIKVPFDLAHWQKVAAQEYPQGLPKPFSSDPRQWLFNGHPKGAEQALQVGVARLLGYRWPRQTGSSFPDCPALGEDGLEKLADEDGIVCIPSVRGEEPAADRLRKLLAAAYGEDWKAGTELELIRATGSSASDLEEWLRNEFFQQHCEVFHQRPFVWHIWDGRKRDGFHALLNCHKLANGAKGRKVLESLTHSYLGEWITRQKDGEKRGEAGAEERLAAALELKKRLEAIIEGEPPHDLFVRWKPLAAQAIGWEPDLNDGVRMNIRPFMASDLPNGKTGAGILRWKPNIKWDKDRGKEPKRDRADFPWFWADGEFSGDRVNNVHLTNEQKRKAPKEN